ncbi:helix-turn-helix domain-containing protein [Nitratireductor mangrovi]|uniref:Helix-turn-helix domain-containing protein n=1 Tax=Nitratireductor mangrovi TaxID=2599600 RepID=A0A5B8KV79_9HYPH|nr:XRE family transcriptional regulator [Nitratireductor mangrovi]QDY99468.1 helix-turn-helix domain-containing protein [Nitratireductor mangrovi]
MDQLAPGVMAPADRRARMGERLRQIRHERGLTLAEVAQRSGLAVSTVSKVERGLMALTYDRFSQLADGLGVDVAALFSEHGERFRPGEVAVARLGEFRLHETDNYAYEMLFPDLWSKAMTPMLGTLRPLETMRFDRFVKHAGEEFLFVVDGRVTVHLEDKSPVVLDRGESIYFDSGRGHLYAAAGTDGARILVVCTRGFGDAAKEEAARY